MDYDEKFEEWCKKKKCAYGTVMPIKKCYRCKIEWCKSQLSEKDKELKIEKQEAELKRIDGLIVTVIDKIELKSCGFEGDEDIITYNGNMIGSTVRKNTGEFGRWLGSFKSALKKEIQQQIKSKE